MKKPVPLTEGVNAAGARSTIGSFSPKTVARGARGVARWYLVQGPGTGGMFRGVSSVDGLVASNLGTSRSNRLDGAKGDVWSRTNPSGTEIFVGAVTAETAV